MNLLLLDPRRPGEAALAGGALTGRVEIVGERARHMASVKQVEAGASVRVGVLFGPRGFARVAVVEAARVVLEVQLDPTDLAPFPWFDLVLGLPRPKQLVRVLHHAVSLGVRRVDLVNTWRVEKSYLATPKLRPEALAAVCSEALEQVEATIPPQIAIHRAFKPFLEDHLAPRLLEGNAREGALLASPAASRAVWELEPPAPAASLTLAIGPERGFTSYETTRLEEAGFTGFHFGERILRVETAVPAIVGYFSALGPRASMK
ncbi:MAG: RsmE family RNA methyltransferase [Planctomycetota bacterium]|jgi:RsmE family RNA methyltransferase